MSDVICLYDESGLAGRPWAEAGHIVYCYDLVTPVIRVEVVGAGALVFMPWDAADTAQVSELVSRHRGRAIFLMGFPPCTDLAVSGAAWFEAKRAADPLFHDTAMALFRVPEAVADALGVPFFIENPVSVASSLWRKPDHSFHPYEYGGYLPEDDVHPMFPEYIEAMDAYPKKTCYWTGNGFVMPPKAPVPVEPGYSKQHKMLGGKGARTKRIRSLSPRGVARAVFEFNRPLEARAAA